MRAGVVITAVAVAAATTLVVGPEPAWAGDLGGQNNYSNAQASGGQVSVQAGVTRWTPPGG